MKGKTMTNFNIWKKCNDCGFEYWEDGRINTHSCDKGIGSYYDPPSKRTPPTEENEKLTQTERDGIDNVRKKFTELAQKAVQLQVMIPEDVNWNLLGVKFDQINEFMQKTDKVITALEFIEDRMERLNHLAEKYKDSIRLRDTVRRFIKLSPVIKEIYDELDLHDVLNDD